MKLYKISGSSEYVDWDILHNQQGYSTSATTPVTWKSSLGNTWGETVANGYMEPTAASGWATKGFCLGKRGWHNMDDMANIYYVWPDVATSAKARHDTWGESDVAVWDYDGTHTLYLVQKELEEGWMDEDTFAERGWEIVPDVPLGELVFVDASTGDVVYSVESLNEMVFAPTGYFTIEDTGDIVFVEQSPYPIVSRFRVDFDTVQTLADGAHIDTVLPYYTSKLYIAGIVNRVAETIVDFGLTVSNEGRYVRVTNNTGASVTLTRLAIQSMDAADAEVVEVVDGQDNHAYAFKWDDGGTPYWWISYSGERHWTDTLGGWSEVPSVVLPTVMFSDDISSGTVSLLTLPTEHSGYYTDAKFGSLRYYVKGTVSDPEYFYGLYGISAEWYGGKITWFDSSIGDLSDKLFTTGTPDAGTSRVQQTILRVHLITNGSIGGYSVWDTINNSFIGQISNYTYNNGQHSITLWFNNIGGDWTTFDGAGRLMLRYLDGTTAFNNLDSFNLFNVSSGTLSKATTTDRYDMYNVWNDSVTLNARYASCSGQGVTTVTVYNSSNVAYNAFKYTTNGTDYYYVLDGTQTDWTDDLASIGYRLPKILYLALNKSAVRVTALGPYTYGYELYNEDGSTFISSSLPTLLEAWSDSSESSKIADFSNRIGLVIKSNNVVLDGKGSYNTWVQRISVL